MQGNNSGDVWGNKEGSDVYSNVKIQLEMHCGGGESNLAAF